MNKEKHMKKLINSTVILAFLLGCAQNKAQIQKNLNVDIQLISKYKITKDALISYKNFYYFANIETNGISINKLDKNYNLIAKKIINALIEPKKYLIKNNHFYILGYNNSKQKPVILDISLKNLKLIKTVYLGKKYSLPADFFINKDIYTAINVFNPKTDSDIYIYKNSSLFSKIASDKKENAKYIFPFNNGLLILGNIAFINDDILIVLTDKNGKIVKARRVDLGMDDYINSVIIKNNQIIINATSTDNMGAEVDYILTFDKNLNVLKSKKNLEFRELPIKFRT
jgi:hypothetical protein